MAKKMLPVYTPHIALQFQLGLGEIIFLIMLALVLSELLPELAKAAGKAVRIFREVHRTKRVRVMACRCGFKEDRDFIPLHWFLKLLGLPPLPSPLFPLPPPPAPTSKTKGTNRQSG